MSRGECLSLRVEVSREDHEWTYGVCCLTDEPVIFKHHGHTLGPFATLYGARFSGVKYLGAWLFEVGASEVCCSSVPPVDSLRWAHDLCCGLGGFSTAWTFLGGVVASAVDWNELACTAFSRSHPTPLLHADIALSSTVRDLHVLQLAQGVQPWILAGFPCQPYSVQGSLGRDQDPRSAVLDHILLAGHLLNAVGYILECVPEAYHDKVVQKTLHTFAAQQGMKLTQVVLPLHSIWASRRTRWFCVIVRDMSDQIPPLPTVNPSPVVRDVVSHWPVWPLEQEEQLRWTPLECQGYRNPEFGPVERRIDLGAPLPTALHSWGSALYMCPCKCRSGGLSPARLRARGLRGIELISARLEGVSRHIHPKELQLLLGLPPFQELIEDYRGALCLLGNCVSPLQVIWVVSHVWKALHVTTADPLDMLQRYMRTLLAQRDLVWPPSTVGPHTLMLHDGAARSVTFEGGTLVGQLLLAEAQLSSQVALCSQGVMVPAHAALQARDYAVIPWTFSDNLDLSLLGICLQHLGAEHHHAVPCFWTWASALQHLGLTGFALVSFDGRPVLPVTPVAQQPFVILQSPADDVEFELALRLGSTDLDIGFGGLADQAPFVGALSCHAGPFVPSLLNVEALESVLGNGAPGVLHAPWQLPIGIGLVDDVSTQGLSASFVRWFADCLVAAQHVVQPAQVRVLSLDSDPDCLQTCVSHLDDLISPSFLVILHRRHWSFAKAQVVGSTLVFEHYDGLGCTQLGDLAPLMSLLQAQWHVQGLQASSSWRLAQTSDVACGTVALGHLAWTLGLLTDSQLLDFESWHPLLARGSAVWFDPRCGFGSSEEAITASSSQILPGKGVPVDKVKSRAQAAIKALGVSPLSKALEAKNVWAALKALGNSRPKPFMWISHEELQAHIQERATGRFGADVDMRKPRGKKDRKPPAPQTVRLLDPSMLVLPAGVFASNDNTPLPQLQLAEVQKNARGIAFAGVGDIAHFLQDGKFISTEALALLVIGKLPDGAPPLPMHQVRVPAIYKGTQEPVLIDCTSVQLGDQAVYKVTAQTPPELVSFPTRVFRAHIFRDLWEEQGDWTALIAKPVRCLVDCFPCMKLCEDKDCNQLCEHFHPSLEEEGAESAIIDVWGYHWHMLDGVKATPSNAAVLSLYLRVLESNFEVIHALSGTAGTFFEPRCTDKPGPDPQYAVIWIPKSTLKEAQHRVRTLDPAIAVCRLGSKYGVRCLAKHEATVHQDLRPDRPFVQCVVSEVYRVEPLPIGTQRQSLVEVLQTIGWNAKPLQPCRGSQGKAWQVGAAGPPSSPFIEAKHGWITITKVRDSTPSAPPQDLVATFRTRQHIREQPASSSASTDPWTQAGADPWASFQGVTRPAQSAPDSTHVQKRLDDVEQRVQDSVQSHLTKSLSAFEQQASSSMQSQAQRLTSVEQQLQTLSENQGKLKQWCEDGSRRIAQVQVEQNQLQQSVQQCVVQISDQGNVLGQVVSEVGSFKETFKSSLESYFERQTEKIADMMAKKRCTE
eukprot:Skav235966  [mRNA]  locus=scaffold592:118205:122734:+ [translate_table: standard]